MYIGMFHPKSRFFLIFLCKDVFVSLQGELRDDIVYDFRFAAEVEFRIRSEIVCGDIEPSRMIAGDGFPGEMDLIGEVMDLFDPLFVEKILLIRDGEEELFGGRAGFRHVQDRRDAYSGSDEDFWRRRVFEDEVAEWSLEDEFPSDAKISDSRSPSSVFHEFDGEDEHCLLVVGISIHYGIRSLELALPIVEDKHDELARQAFHLLRGLEGELYDICCQHLTIDDLGFYRF